MGLVGEHPLWACAQGVQVQEASCMAKDDGMQRLWLKIVSRRCGAKSLHPDLLIECA